MSDTILTARSRKVYTVLLWIASALCAGGIAVLSLLTGDAVEAVLRAAVRICEVLAGTSLEADAALFIRECTPSLLFFLAYGLLALCVWGALALMKTTPLFSFDTAFIGCGLLAVLFWLICSEQNLLCGAAYLIAGGIGIVACLLVLLLLWLLNRKIPKIVNYETLSYLVFGVLTTLVSYISFMIFTTLTKPFFSTVAATVIDNIGSWICAVLFAYIVNRIFVFRSEAHGAPAILKEIGLFVGARLLSLGVEMLLLIPLISWFHVSEAISKIAVSIVVLILNYFFSKLIIFRKKSKQA